MYDACVCAQISSSLNIPLEENAMLVLDKRSNAQCTCVGVGVCVGNRVVPAPHGLGSGYVRGWRSSNRVVQMSGGYSGSPGGWLFSMLR